MRGISLHNCKYFIATTFAHTAAGIGIAAVSAEYPVLYTALQEQLRSRGLSSFIIALSAIALVFVLPLIAPNTPLKYIAAIAFAYLLGQMSGPLVKLLDERNILGLGPYLFGALIGLIVAQFILFILEATTAVKKQQYFQGAKVLSFFGTALFSLFAAYDTQIVKLHARTCKKQGYYIEESMGLFLDFINLFQNIGVAGLSDD